MSKGTNGAVRVLAVDDPAVRAYAAPGGDGGCAVEFVVEPWERYGGLMEAALAGKADYDVVMVAGHLWKRDLVDAGLLLPLDALDEDVIGSVAQECSHAGRTYLSPSFCDGHMVVFDKERAGGLFDSLDPVAIPPAEYIGIAQKLGAGAVAVKAHPSEIFTDALPFLRMHGGDAYDSAGNPVCDSDEAVRGLGEYLRLREFACGRAEDSGNAEVADALSSGRAAIGITWSGQLGVVASARGGDMSAFGFRTLTTAWNTTWSFAVAASSRRAEQAKALLARLRAPEVDRLAGECSGAPIRRSTYAEDAGRHPWYSCQLGMIETCARPLPDIRNAASKNACLYREIHACFTGRKSAREALETAAAEIRAL